MKLLLSVKMTIKIKTLLMKKMIACLLSFSLLSTNVIHARTENEKKIRFPVKTVTGSVLDSRSGDESESCYGGADH